MTPRPVAVVAFEGISPFHLSVPCIVFGEDRRADGIPRYDMRVCVAGRSRRVETGAGFSITADHGLEALSGAGTVIVPTWRSTAETPPAATAGGRTGHVSCPPPSARTVPRGFSRGRQHGATYRSPPPFARGATTRGNLPVSTKKLSEKDLPEEGFSIAAQREACVRRSRDEGWELVDDYVDRGESARTGDPPRLQAMLAPGAGEAAGVDAIVVHEVDHPVRDVGRRRSYSSSDDVRQRLEALEPAQVMM